MGLSPRRGGSGAGPEPRRPALNGSRTQPPPTPLKGSPRLPTRARRHSAPPLAARAPAPRRSLARSRSGLGAGPGRLGGSGATRGPGGGPRRLRGAGALLGPAGQGLLRRRRRRRVGSRARRARGTAPSAGGARGATTTSAGCTRARSCCIQGARPPSGVRALGAGTGAPGLDVRNLGPGTWRSGSPGSETRDMGPGV